VASKKVQISQHKIGRYLPIPLFCIFTVWLTWPALSNFQNTLVGTVGEDSTAQAAYRNLASFLGISVFDRHFTNLIGYPNGGFIEQEQSYYTPLSSLIREWLSLFFSGIEINLLLVIISIMISSIVGYYICYAITSKVTYGLLGSFILSVTPYRLHWSSAVNDLDSTPFILLYVYISMFSKTKEIFRLFSAAALSIFVTLWQPWNGILIFLLQISQVLYYSLREKTKTKIALLSSITFLCSLFLIKFLVNESNASEIDWLAGDPPAKNNLFKFSWINPESRAFINPILILAFIVYCYLEYQSRSDKIYQEIEQLKLEVSRICVITIAITFLVLGPYSFFGFPTLASKVPSFIPQLRNGTYGMLLIQVCFVLIFINVLGNIYKNRKRFPYFPTSFVAIFSFLVFLFAIHFPTLKSVEEDASLFPHSKKAVPNKSRWMTEIYPGFDTQMMEREIRNLKEGPILIFPYGTIYGDDPVNCFFAVDKNNPLVNSCSFLKNGGKSSYIEQIKTESSVCGQIKVARKLGLKYFLFLGYGTFPESQDCVKEYLSLEGRKAKLMNIGGSSEVVLLNLEK
jgi:hypothetical protein